MDKNEKQFWMDPSEPQDQASRQVIRALHELYRVDEDDKRSVERAWQRIAYEAHMQEQLPERMPKGNAEFFERSRPPSQRSSYSVTWRKPASVMVAVLISFLLIGSMVGVFALMQRQSGQQGQQPGSPTVQQQIPTPSSGKPLGKSLGRVTLGMSTDEIWAVLGEVKPIPDPDSIDAGTYLYYREIGIQLMLKPSDSDQQWGKVVQMVAHGPFQGETAEGFGLGMTPDEFTRLYASYAIERIDPQKVKFAFPLYAKPPGIVFAVTDSDGTVLYVIFDQQQKAAQLVLQSGNDLKFKQNVGW